ncbi:hypothetical protein ACLMPP_21230 [Yersinia enterocolitica]|uniref:hypothetical protein n=1 Tax=Yersinia enterocolitica TaxID=630 RepID=UPI00398D3DBF
MAKNPGLSSEKIYKEILMLGGIVMHGSPLTEHKEEYDRMYGDFRIITSQQLSGCMDSTRARDAWRRILPGSDLYVLADVLSDVFFDLSRKIKA